MANEINAERIQLMIQTALAAQVEVYAKESADRERILLADFEVRLPQHDTAVNHTPPPPASPNSSTRSTIPKICLNMGSPSILYNGLGGTSTSALSKAAANEGKIITLFIFKFIFRLLLLYAGIIKFKQISTILTVYWL